ncbi:YcgL domain-containing protein [Alteromonas gilva]|uniref:YcgL domain-containing protein OIK42_07430 n=1 Tax=Alteromonas gilva TaxID=2987522 RepID=A0ABT5L2D7_9ALTE|nr:YcgL domain-containing protein [Alteromonas gilva]MDC8830589.1 YcgL domain-containing protein [Alteromonas gilva]
MLIAVYKTLKKEGMYLYVPNKDDFSAVPEPLMARFGEPQLVMMLPIAKRKTLGGVDKQKLLDAMDDPGFYLQVPPKEENWLEAHLIEQGKSPRSAEG